MSNDKQLDGTLRWDGRQETFVYSGTETHLEYSPKVGYFKAVFFGETLREAYDSDDDYDEAVTQPMQRARAEVSRLNNLINAWARSGDLYFPRKLQRAHTLRG